MFCLLEWRTFAEIAQRAGGNPGPRIPMEMQSGAGILLGTVAVL